jgi:hypothetical protein
MFSLFSNHLTVSCITRKQGESLGAMRTKIHPPSKTTATATKKKHTTTTTTPKPYLKIPKPP